MRTFVKLLPLATLLASTLAFQPSTKPPAHSSSPDDLRVSSASEFLTESSSSTRSASLVFQGDCSVLTDPLPPDTTFRDVSDFFADPDSRMAFCSGGDAQEAPFDEWEPLWRDCCHEWYGKDCLPSEGDKVFRVDTWTHFPGLKVCTTVFAGVKVLAKEETTTPRCCVVVIGQEQSAKGLPPVLWVFDKIMGTSNSKKKSAKPMGPVKSFYSVEKQPDDDNDNNRLCIKLETAFRFDIRFPSKLLKLLPMSKTKAEEQGSAALSKSIAQSGRQGISTTYRAFKSFQQAREKEMAK